MRTLASFNAPTPAAAAITKATVATQQRSPWHSPVPYLFGGLAAMLGLIAFALLILACSYWKLSDSRDIESGDKGQEGDAANSVKVYEEKILVIMAGDEKPTFLATPVCTKPSSFVDGKQIDKNEQGENFEIGEKVKEVTDHEDNHRENQETQGPQVQNQ
ncbi:hypothetical protein CISIN_1g042254mg [Citrus sinensis]|uniref:Uncharacterized protein n=1 Tax=Citrus sinensis TaxID=2711 RepID=A0A067FJ20_CITSI|nr:hypothetical protein CISIN_1g042254mg [Citrus sinensis]